MKRTLSITVGASFVMALACLFLMPGSIPPSVSWDKYALVILFSGSAILSLLLLKHTNGVGKLFIWLYVVLAGGMGIMWAYALRYLLARTSPQW
jgi:hypothetical protein